MSDLSSRVPLRLPTASATFLVGIAGFLGVNVSPYMITALQITLGLDPVAASWIITLSLLATAIAGLSIAPLCAGLHRRAVAVVGMSVALAGYVAAAVGSIGVIVIPGLVVGGLGAGAAVAAAGASLAAFRNPDRVAGFNGLANRGVVTIVLAVVPLIGLAAIDVFGTLALFALIGIVIARWLPAAPVATPQAAAATAEAVPLTVPPTGTIRSVTPPRRATTIAGFGLLLVFAIWAVSEDSLWAMAGLMGSAQAGLTPEGLGIALSASTAGGLIGSLILMTVGTRLGRTVPLVVLLLVGSVMKFTLGFVTDPTLFIVNFVVWNSLYAVAFMYFVATATALDASGRWSGPLLSVYLVGSALTPVIGAGMVDLFGYLGFVTVLAAVSALLALPAGIIATISRRSEARTSIPTQPEEAIA